MDFQQSPVFTSLKPGVFVKERIKILIGLGKNHAALRGFTCENTGA